MDFSFCLFLVFISKDRTHMKLCVHAAKAEKKQKNIVPAPTLLLCAASP